MGAFIVKTQIFALKLAYFKKEWTKGIFSDIIET